jgi:hypothetical protein
MRLLDCMIMPRYENTDIGASESPGLMQSFCSAEAHTDGSQGQFPDSFWRQVAFESGNGVNGQRYVQRELNLISLINCLGTDSRVFSKSHWVYQPRVFPT